MAFGRLDRGIGTQPMSDINVTPLVDVMLVLLVIFMITAPLMSSNLRLNLPTSDAAQPNEAPAFVTISVAPDGQLNLGNEPITADALAAQLTVRARQNPALEVHLRADKQVPYGQVAELLGLIQKAGLVRIGFVTEPVTANTPAR